MFNAKINFFSSFKVLIFQPTVLPLGLCCRGWTHHSHTRDAPGHHSSTLTGGAHEVSGY
jgi:hypothetical protein